MVCKELDMTEQTQHNEVFAFFFFFLHYFKTVTAGIRQPGNWGPLVSGVLACSLLSEMQTTVKGGFL